ncbi:MAG: hypothetical protein JST22_11865 [Bacteroidetes bacterium]|nr:hypothetical protein [Bacteroidota bacterium]
MRTYTIVSLLAATLTLAACGGKSEPGSAPKSGTAARDTAGTRSHDDAPHPVPHVVVHDFDIRKIPAACRYSGEVLGGARWDDANGDNVLIVTHTMKVPPGAETDESNARAEQIIGILYATSGGGTKQLWKIQDAANNVCDLGHGLLSKIVVADLDSDGVAENAFVYNIEGSCDVSPITVKLIMHSGTTKLAIRGTTRAQVSENSIVGGEKTFDPAFNGLPESYREFASQLWEKSVRPIDILMPKQ